MELTFNETVGNSEVKGLLSEVTEDGKLGDLEVGQVVTDGFIKGQLFLHYNYILTSNKKWYLNCN